MFGFWIFMLATELFIPFTMLGCGFYFSKHTPKEINTFWGYRTVRSMKNKDTWEFANRFFGKLWKITGAVMVPITFIVMLFSFGKSIDYISYYGLVVVFIQLMILIGSVFPVEAALNKEFDDDGNRREGDR